MPRIPIWIDNEDWVENALQAITFLPLLWEDKINERLDDVSTTHLVADGARA